MIISVSEHGMIVPDYAFLLYIELHYSINQKIIFTSHCKTDQPKFRRSGQFPTCPTWEALDPFSSQTCSNCLQHEPKHNSSSTHSDCTLVYLVFFCRVVVVLCSAVESLICCGYFCRQQQQRQKCDLWLKPELEAHVDSAKSIPLEQSLSSAAADAWIWRCSWGKHWICIKHSDDVTHGVLLQIVWCDCQG